MIGSLIGKMADAQKLSIAQIQKAVATGSLPSYIGIPLIEEKTKEAQKYQMAQAILKEQGTPDVSVKDQVMQAADQVTRPEPPVMPSTPDGYRQQPAPSQGVESLASNMPEEYAGGGIIAFADRGVVPGAEDIPIPGKDKDDKDTKAAGFGSDLAEYFARNPFVKRVAEMPERWAPRIEEYKRALSEAESKPVNILPDIGTLSGEPRAQQVSSAPQGDGLEFLNRPNLPQSPAPRQDYLSSLGAPPSAVPTPQARPAASGVDQLPIQRREVAPPAAPPAAPQEANPFSGIDELMGRRAEEGKSSREELRDLILGQKADRAERQKSNVGTSLMEAGFGMMAGESPFAGVNIGRGALVGAKSYARGIEQLREDDAKVVNQLVSLGLKGEELDNAAMKMGIDLEQLKTMRPYYQALGKQAEQHAQLYGPQAQLMGAQREETEAQTLERLTNVNLAPSKLELQRMKAAGATGADKAGFIPASALDKLDERVAGWIANPLDPSTPFSGELYKNKQLVKALQLNDPENPEYQKALDVVRNLAETAKLRKMADYRRESERRRLTSTTSSDED